MPTEPCAELRRASPKAVHSSKAKLKSESGKGPQPWAWGGAYSLLWFQEPDNMYPQPASTPVSAPDHLTIDWIREAC